MKNRLGIFCFYDKDGVVDEYVDYLLKELTTCLSRLIIVINGNVSGEGRGVFKKYSQEMVVRKNEGFDVGAYKDILINYLGTYELDQYDEIVLCNDSFFGPLIPFQKIFNEMANIFCDFWGLNYVRNNILNHLQSYFLVFRRAIIEDKSLLSYLKSDIDEKNLDYRVACAGLETGLFSYLVNDRGKNFAFYSETNNCHIYKSSGYCIKKYRLPILKKKVFSEEYYIEDTIKELMNYIMYHTNYDVTYILKAVERKYLIHITKEDIEQYSTVTFPEKEIYFYYSQKGRKDIKEFISTRNSFYIFGDGIWAVEVFWVYARNNPGFKGFIISQDMIVKEEYILGYPVKKALEIKNLKKQNILVILNPENSRNVRSFLGEGTNIFYL